MSDMNMQRRGIDLAGTVRAPVRLSLGQNLMLYSQYILIALLVVGALVLRLVFGAP